MPARTKTKEIKPKEKGVDTEEDVRVAFSLSASKKAFDPTLASLFSSSAGPVKLTPKHTAPESDPPHVKEKSNSKHKPAHVAKAAEEDEEEDDELLSSLDEDEMDYEDTDEDRTVEEGIIKLDEDTTTQRKRKRRSDDDDLESAYMQRLVLEEQKEQAKREVASSNKRQKQDNDDENNTDNENSEVEEDALNDDGDALSESDMGEIPQHESLAGPKTDDELDKAARTVFLGNVSTEAITSKSARKTLMSHLASFVPSLAAHNPPYKVESLRFRSTAFSSSVPKKAAFAKKELMDTTTKSTNAYVVYSDKVASREAAKRLNGSIVLGRHLRVDEVSHPAKVDHHRCVFVGNLGFVDDDSQIKAAEDPEGTRRQRKTVPGDVEEGLWVQFGKAGTVESVRVVRDPKTRVGKGFAYVQFTDQNAVEAALLYNDKRFPPLLPRKLRVVRAKKQMRNPKPSGPPSRGFRENGSDNKRRKPNSTAEQASLKGRASKLLGRAGAASLRANGKEAANVKPLRTGEFAKGPIRKPEDFVFEGHRASSKQGNSGLKLGRNGNKGKGRPKNRSAQRGAEWKRQGGNEGKSKSS